MASLPSHKQVQVHNCPALHNYDLFWSHSQECPFYLIRLANFQAQRTYDLFALWKLNPFSWVFSTHPTHSSNPWSMPEYFLTATRWGNG